jgi:PAS domain S-box-containing protein
MRWSHIDNVHARVSICLFAALGVTIVIGIMPLRDRPLTAALTYLLVVLPISIAWGYRYAVGMSVLAALGFFWLVPPWRHFWFSDTRGLLALSAFLVVGVVASYLSERARSEAINAKERHAEAVAAQRQFTDLVNSVESIVWEADAATMAFTFVSRQAERVLGYGVERWLTEAAFWKEHLHPEDRDQTIDSWIMFAVEKKGWSSEFRMIAADGRIVWLRALVTVVVEDDRATRLRGVMIDTTEHKRYETELHNYKEQLEELVRQRTTELVEARDRAEAANRSKSVFLANMSHELRTPLNAVLGFSSLMRNEPGISEGQRNTLDIITRSGEHLLSLINDVLDVARIEAGKTTLTTSPCGLAEMVRDITDMMRQRAEEKGLRLVYEQASHVPPIVRIDAPKLRQVLINLINNAIKFTESGTVTLHLEATDNRDARTKILTFEVRDTGCGIEAADQPRIFDPFVQVGDTEARKGTGLGLTITKQYVELMGGAISVESAIGEGSLFRVWIPVEVMNEYGTIPSGSNDRLITLMPGQPEYRILVVEDEPDNSLLLCSLLERAGFAVCSAENGQLAVDAFLEWQPQFIWMDRHMPVMDGIEATRAIRELPGGRDVTIVGVSAFAFTDQREESLRAGMDDFVGKPYRADEIYQLIANHLGVKYVDGDLKLVPQAGSAALSVLPPVALAMLPADLHHRLKSAILDLDTDEIGRVIREISTVDPEVSRLLSAYAERFAYTKILEALDARSDGPFAGGS